MDAWQREDLSEHLQALGLAESDAVEAFLATGQGSRGRAGKADSVLVPAREIVEFAVRWLEARFPLPSPAG